MSLLSIVLKKTNVLAQCMKIEAKVLAVYWKGVNKEM